MIANLCVIPTRDVNELQSVANDPMVWHAARAAIEEVVEQSEALVAGWGVRTWSGPSALHLRDQLRFVHQVAIRAGKVEIWTLRGEARHPSRWHQYVSDRHGRTTGAGLAARLVRVLEPVPLEAALGVA